MPKELHRADYAVSSNLGQTIDAARQAIIDSRSCLHWLQSQGNTNLGIIGTSLGASYAFVASAHDERVRMNVCNLFSFHFSYAVWSGITTRHIRKLFEGCIELEMLRDCWKAISPSAYVDRYGRYNCANRSLFTGTAFRDSRFLLSGISLPPSSLGLYH
jgi:hypothetical protein